MFTKTCRVGNEPSIRYTTNNNAVLELSLAYQYGRKAADGKRPTQWLRASLWGKQAEALQPYINKGDQVSVSINDLHIQEYESKGVAGHKLTGTIVEFDFCGKSQASNNKPESKPNQENEYAKASSGSGFGDIPSDVPF